MRVTNEEKKVFIDWLLENYKFKGDDYGHVVKFLTDIRDMKKLSKVEFVSGYTEYTNTIFINTLGTEGNINIKLITDYHATSIIPINIRAWVKNNVEEDTERLEIIVNFNGINAPEYRAVVDGGLNEVDVFLDELQRKREIELIKKDIDDSLSEMNKDKFMELTNKLKQIIG